MQKWKNGPIETIGVEHRLKIGLDLICEFLHQWPDDEFELMGKANFSVKDYSLEQFQWWIGRRLDEERKKNAKSYI